VFSADSITPHLVSGHLTEFRRGVAQMENPELFAVLGVRPLPVCGVLRCADGVVAGRRRRARPTSPDAGAVSEEGLVNSRRQLLGELQEELGLSPDMVGEPRPLCIVEHPGSRVSDFGLAWSTDLTAEAVLCAHRAGRNPEELRGVPEAELATFLTEAAESGDSGTDLGALIRVVDACTRRLAG
jgi:hypothetical protein